MMIIPYTSSKHTVTLFAPFGQLINLLHDECTTNPRNRTELSERSTRIEQLELIVHNT